MKKLTTKKLFFNRYPYKVETKIDGASLIRYWGVDIIKSELSKTGENKLMRGSNSRINKEELLKYIRFAEQFLNGSVQLRGEYRTMNYYTDDKSVYEELQAKLYPWVESITEPESLEELAVLQTEKKKLVLCNSLPYDLFKHRLYIKTKMPVPMRVNFLSWLGNYPNKIQPTESTKKWLTNENKYMQDPFIYVDDSKTLTMISMFLGQYVGKIEEFVVRNT